MINVDMYQLITAGVLALLLGLFLNSKIRLLRQICIPAPVTGGIIISLLILFAHIRFGVEFKFDNTLKDVCMMIFFSSVGFQSNFTVFKSGGRMLGVMVVLVAVLIIFQNIVGLGVAKILGVNPLIGLSAGSIAMAGGHGTAAGFSSLMESRGLESAGSIMMAAATFGLLAGSLIGGPLGEHLINRFKLEKEQTDLKEEMMEELGHQGTEKQSFRGYTEAIYEIIISIGLGTFMSKVLSMTGISFPIYFGTLIVAAILRNCSELISGCPKLAVSEIISIGNISLSLFLGMAMVSLRLWELADAALPLLLILILQVILIGVFARWVAFPLLGKNYDAALLISGLCGFGLGATPNAMANMTAISAKYRYSPVPFIVVPLIGAMFVDIINITIITTFLNII